MLAPVQLLPALLVKDARIPIAVTLHTILALPADRLERLAAVQTHLARL